jgi:2-polyprenyl-3-methyl-5-hydroxy-6-metoxy-1,4-benzoquinol methylase
LKRAEWNEIADDFEDYVCDVAVDETNDQLRRFVNASRPSPKSSVLVDLGCGIGSFIQTFGERFKEIVGVEYAPRIIARAKKRCAAIDVEWLTMDAARAAMRIGPRADLTVCLNVITSASAPVRHAQWAGVAAVTKPQGHALLVLPSLESEEMLQRQSLRDVRNEKFQITEDGLVETEGSFQKHYRQEEVSAIAASHGLEVKRIARIVSSWSRTGLRKPRSGDWENPWDWIVLAQKPLVV